jgi:GT2 family glycosyltransferase
MTGGAAPTAGALTVVIPTHGRPAGLAAALSSLANATPPPAGMAVVVVADGEQPPVRAAVALARREGLDVELREQARSGPASARNRGALGARTVAIAFLDDDCQVAEGWPAAICAALAREPDAIIGGPIVNGCPDRLASVASHLVLSTVTRWMAEHDRDQAFVASMNAGMSVVTFNALRGFDAAFPTPAAEDRDFCERATRSGRRLVEDPNALVVHHHELGLLGLWRQQFAYGRGAAQLRASRQRRGEGSSGPRLRLYVELARAALAGDRRSATLSAVVLAQIAYLAGWLREAIVRGSVGSGQTSRES